MGAGDHSVAVENHLGSHGRCSPLSLVAAAGNSNPGNYWVVGVGEESHRDRHDSLCRVLDLKDSESCTRHGRESQQLFTFML